MGGNNHEEHKGASHVPPTFSISNIRLRLYL